MKKIISEYQLLEYIYTNIEISTNEVKDHFFISTSTLNRQLRVLKNNNWIFLRDNTIVYKPASYFSYTDLKEVQEKNSLAQFSVSLIQEQKAICLSGGSTTVALMCPFILLYKKNITIISNNILVLKTFLDLNALAIKNNISLVTLGGLLQTDMYSFGGEYAEQILSNFHIDQSFIGVESINLENNGLYTAILKETDIENAVKKHSKTNYIVCLENKFVKQELYKWASVTDFDGIISNYSPSTNSPYQNLIISPK